jgi:hypothetical protein
MIGVNFTPQSVLPQPTLQRFNDAITKAHRAGDARRLDRLLRRKMHILRKFHAGGSSACAGGRQ